MTVYVVMNGRYPVGVYTDKEEAEKREKKEERTNYYSGDNKVVTVKEVEFYEK